MLYLPSFVRMARDGDLLTSIPWNLTLTWSLSTNEVGKSSKGGAGLCDIHVLNSSSCVVQMAAIEDALKTELEQPCKKRHNRRRRGKILPDPDRCGMLSAMCARPPSSARGHSAALMGKRQHAGFHSSAELIRRHCGSTHLLSST